MILADTNIFIEYYKNNLTICRILDSVAPQEIVASDVVCAELTLNRKDFAFIPNLKLYEQ